MEYAAAERGASITGVSISKSQCEFAAARLQTADGCERSEERRVGKEGRSRGSPYH